MNLLKAYRLWRIARKIRGGVIVERFKSRKFWAAVVSAVIVAAGNQVGLDESQVQMIVVLAVGYIFGQGVADGLGGKR